MIKRFPLLLAAGMLAAPSARADGLKGLEVLFYFAVIAGGIALVSVVLTLVSWFRRGSAINLAAWLFTIPAVLVVERMLSPGASPLTAVPLLALLALAVLAMRRSCGGSFRSYGGAVLAVFIPGLLIGKHLTLFSTSGYYITLLLTTAAGGLCIAFLHSKERQRPATPAGFIRSFVAGLLIFLPATVLALFYWQSRHMAGARLSDLLMAFRFSGYTFVAAFLQALVAAVFARFAFAGIFPPVQSRQQKPD